MNKTLRIIGQWGGVIGILLVVALLIRWSRQTSESPLCQSLHIVIKDYDERQYVNSSSIEKYLRLQDLYPVGLSLDNVSTQEIETSLNSHPLVRRAECYKTSRGGVEVMLTQRIPLLKVQTESDAYYIDSDHQRMPISQTVKTPVLLVKGVITPEMAKHELAAFAEWLQEDTFWHSRIYSLEMNSHRQVTLRQTQQQPPILLGTLGDYKVKLKRYRHFLEKTHGQMNLPTYQTIDLRFENQVIGCK